MNGTQLASRLTQPKLLLQCKGGLAGQTVVLHENASKVVDKHVKLQLVIVRDESLWSLLEQFHIARSLIAFTAFAGRHTSQFYRGFQQILRYEFGCTQDVGILLSSSLCDSEE